MLHHRLITLLLILITLTAFWRAASCQFVNFDDPQYTYANPRVLQGLTARNIAWAFTTGHTGYYQPLTWLSLMLDSDLQGVPTRPREYHVTNILLHALAAALLYLALQSLTAAPWRSALVALIFAIHPLRVESVAWISERNCVLSGCLAFAVMIAYAAYAHRPGWFRYLLVILLFALGLLAKPSLVPLPCLLFLFDIWPLRRMPATRGLPAPSPQALPCLPQSMTWLLLEKVPLLVLSLYTGVITWMIQVRTGTASSLSALPLWARLNNIPVAYVRYIVKMVWFQGLIIIYPIHDWPLWQSVGAAILLVAATAAVLLRFRQNPWLALGWFWFLGMLVPVIGLIQSGFQAMADRYSYLSSIGLLIMLVWSLPDHLFHRRPSRLALSAVVFSVVVILGFFTWRQIGYWQDSVTLFSHTIDFSSDNLYALTDLGQALDQERGQPEQALIYFRRVADIAPDYALAQINLANLLQRLGKSHDNQAFLEESLEHLQRAAQLEPDTASSYNAMGAIYMAQGKLDLALREFQHAIKLDPDFAVAHANIGYILAQQKHFEAALAQYQQALSIDPENPEFRDSLTQVQTAQEQLKPSYVTAPAKP